MKSQMRLTNQTRVSFVGASFCATSSPGSSRFRHIGKREDPGEWLASAHPLSQAQGGLFLCVDYLCLFVTERVLAKTTLRVEATFSRYELACEK